MQDGRGSEATFFDVVPEELLLRPVNADVVNMRLQHTRGDGSPSRKELLIRKEYFRTLNKKRPKDTVITITAFSTGWVRKV